LANIQDNNVIASYQYSHLTAFCIKSFLTQCKSPHRHFWSAGSTKALKANLTRLAFFDHYRVFELVIADCVDSNLLLQPAGYHFSNRPSYDIQTFNYL